MNKKKILRSSSVSSQSDFAGFLSSNRKPKNTNFESDSWGITNSDVTSDFKDSFQGKSFATSMSQSYAGFEFGRDSKADNSKIVENKSNRKRQKNSKNEAQYSPVKKLLQDDSDSEDQKSQKNEDLRYDDDSQMSNESKYETGGLRSSKQSSYSNLKKGRLQTYKKQPEIRLDKKSYAQASNNFKKQKHSQSLNYKKPDNNLPLIMSQSEQDSDSQSIKEAYQNYKSTIKVPEQSQNSSYSEANNQRAKQLKEKTSLQRPIQNKFSEKLVSQKIYSNQPMPQRKYSNQSSFPQKVSREVKDIIHKVSKKQPLKDQRQISHNRTHDKKNNKTKKDNSKKLIKSKVANNRNQLQDEDQDDFDDIISQYSKTSQQRYNELNKKINTKPSTREKEQSKPVKISPSNSSHSSNSNKNKQPYPKQPSTVRSNYHHNKQFSQTYEQTPIYMNQIQKSVHEYLKLMQTSHKYDLKDYKKRYGWMRQTIDKHLSAEINFLANAVKNMREIIEGIERDRENKGDLVGNLKSLNSHYDQLMVLGERTIQDIEMKLGFDDHTYE